MLNVNITLKLQLFLFLTFVDCYSKSCYAWSRRINKSQKLMMI